MFSLVPASISLLGLYVLLSYLADEENYNTVKKGWAGSEMSIYCSSGVLWGLYDMLQVIPIAGAWQTIDITLTKFCCILLLYSICT